MTQTLAKDLRAATVALTALAFGGAVPLAAQSTAPSENEPAGPAQQGEVFTEEKIDAFVIALQQVDRIRKSYVPQIRAAETREEQAALVESANAEIVERIEETPGMSVDEYLDIGERAQRDPQLSQRIQSHFEGIAE